MLQDYRLKYYSAQSSTARAKLTEVNANVHGRSADKKDIYTSISQPVSLLQQLVSNRHAIMTTAML